MDGGFEDWQVHQWLQEVADAGWISLHYDSPGLDLITRAEIEGGGYTRFKMAFSQPANRTIWSLIDARFTGLLQTRLTHFGVWTDEFQGSLRASGRLPEAVTVLNGKGYILHAGELALSIG